MLRNSVARTAPAGAGHTFRYQDDWPDWGPIRLVKIGAKDDPWALKTPPGTSGYTMYRDDDVLVCQVGSTTLKYQGPVRG